MKTQIPKGLFDILPTELKEENQWRLSSHYQHVEQILREVSHDYGFREVRTPIFERTELFTRTVGETSDIVAKEMYTFEDKAGRSMSLRPEGTAPLVRAFIENQMQQLGTDHKFFYIGPYFRYDRPQAGRYRQFHQYGVEAIGDPSPEQDVEIIHMTLEIYRRLGLKNLKLLVNSIGDEETRPAYVSAFKEFLKPHFNDLSEDSQVRFEKNPLRILDTKNEKEQHILKGAPSVLDFLSEEAKGHFSAVLKWLDNLGVPYEVTPSLVRGLDYYNRTVFEVTSSVLGAQNTIGAGGRYDGLFKQLGGPHLPATGFATGLERVLQTMSGQKAPFPEPPAPLVMLVPLGDEEKSCLFEMAAKLRTKGIATDIYLKGKKMNKALAAAEKSGARFSLILGEDEFKRGKIQLKTMATRESVEKDISEIIAFIVEQKNR